MAGDQDHKLIVVGLKGKPAEFAKTLERVFGKGQPHPVVEMVPGPPAEFRFGTWGDVDVESTLCLLSGKHRDTTFLLESRFWEWGTRGQLVIRKGRVLEMTKREGYDGPNYLWADITNPVVDLFKAHLTPRTLAQAASSRLEDAIKIVTQLKETLQDERVTLSHYRAYHDKRRVKKAIMDLILMLDAMRTNAAQISFVGVLPEEREEKAT